MARFINALVIADTPRDAEQIIRALSQDEFQVNWTRVASREDYLTGLSPDLDLIVASAPSSPLDAAEALYLLRSRDLDVPFIVVIGTEAEGAVSMSAPMRADACLSRDRLDDLASAVNRSLELRNIRREHPTTGEPDVVLEALLVHQEELRQANQELIQARSALERERRRYQTLFEFAPDGYLVTDSHGIITESNRAAAALFGVSCSVLVGSPLPFLVEESHRAAFRGQLARAPEVGQIVGWETRLQRKGEGSFPAEISVSLASHLSGRSDNGGDAVELRWLIRDISERERAARALRESEQRHRLLVETIADWVWEVDQDGVYTYVSPQAEEIMGYSRAEFLGKTPFDFMDPDEARRVRDVFERMAASGESIVELEDTMVAEDGRHVVFETNGTPLFDDHGELIGYVGTCRDVTERVQAQERLRLQARLLDAIGEAVMATDPEGRLIYWNQAAEALYGWPRDEVLGRNVLDVTPSLGAGDRAEEVLARLRGGETWSGQFRLRCRDGSEVQALVTDTPIRDKHGDVVGIIGVSRDITERVRAEEEARSREETFRALAEENPDIIARFDREARHLYINPAISHYLDLIPDDIVGKTCRELGLPDRLVERWEGLIRAVFDTGEPRETTIEFPGDDGFRLFNARLAPELDARGNVKSAIAAVRDITDLRHAEEAYRALVEHSLQGLCIVQEGRVVFANQKLAEMFGYPPDELLAMSPEEIMATLAPAVRRFVLQLREDRKAGKPTPSHYEIPVRAKSGEIHWTEQFVSSVEFRGVPALQIALIDITDKRQAQQELERRAEQLSAINELAVELTAGDTVRHCFEAVARSLKAITGALAVGISEYDAEAEELVVTHIEADSWLTSRANELLRQDFFGFRSPVTPENRARMIDEVITTAPDLSETTFGAISRSVSNVIQKALGIDRFVGLALAAGDDLLGTMVLVFAPDQPAPSEEVLKTFARVAASSLRQRQTEEALHQISEERRTVLDLIPVGVTITDEEGTIISANRMSEQLLGVAVEEHEGRRYDGPEWEIIRPDGTRMPPEEYASVRALEGQKTVRDVEMGIVKSEGDVTWINVSATPIPLEDYGVVIAYADVTARRDAEAALRARERILNATGRMAKVGGWEHDLRTGEAVWTEALHEIIEIPSDKAPPGVDEHLDYYPQPDREILERAYSRAVEQGEPFDLELRVHTARGELIWCRVQGEPVFQHGACVEMRGTFQDITERKQIQVALRESEAFLRQVIDTSPNCIFVKNWQGEYVLVNEAISNLYNTAKTEMIGKTDRELAGMERLSPQEAEAFLAADREVMSEKRRKVIPEESFTLADGTTRWFQTIKEPLDVQGQRPQLLGVAVDITARKLAEDALRESEERLAQIVEGSSLAGFVIDANHNVTHWNRACEMLSGMSSDEIVGTSDHWRPFYDRKRPMLVDLVVQETSKAEMDRYYGEQLRESSLIPGAYEADHFYPQLGEDGKWLFFSAVPLRDLDGKTIGGVELMRDITPRKEAEERLERRVSELMLLSEIGRRVAGTLDLDAVLREAAQALHQRFGYHNALVLTMDPKGDRLTVREVAGQYADALHHELSVGLDQGVTGWCARHGETILVNDVAADPRYVNSYPDRIVSRSELAVPIRVTGEVVGILDVQSDDIDAFDEGDVLLMETLADQIAVAMENARLYAAEKTARQELGELAGHLQEARETERTRIAREIHDEFGQMMTALKMDLSWLSKRLPDDAPELATKVAAMSSMVDRSFGIVRRVSSELRPSILDDLGLAAAIEWQAEQFSQRSGINARLHLDDPSSVLDRRASTALFRILQEALTNVARHARASEVEIGLFMEPDAVILTINDDGRGITEDQIRGSQSLGLVGMRERVRSLGGELTVEGTPEEGTTVTARVPLAP
jgi:PAS domain S-box-containing protein